MFDLENLYWETNNNKEQEEDNERRAVEEAKRNQFLMSYFK